MTDLVKLIPSKDGTEYFPASVPAVLFTKLAGRGTLTNAHIPLIEKLGFQVTQMNGQPLPPAKAYNRPQPVAVRVREEA